MEGRSEAWTRQGPWDRLGPIPSNTATGDHSGTEGVDFLGRIQLCHLPAVWSWASDFTSLSLNLLI